MTGAEWVDRDGREHFQAADVVLVAANGVGTPRLLLNSADRNYPAGLANSSGLVGCNLMVHPVARVTGYFDEPLQSWQGQYGGLIQSLEFYGSDPARGFVRGSKWSLAPTGGPLNVALQQGRKSVVGAEHHRYMNERFGRGAAWIMLFEDLPDPANRVTLSSNVFDEAGMPAPKVSYALGANVLRMMEWNIERAAESLTEAGAWKLDVVRFRQNSHLMGTARMGDDPATSVVDRWCMSHDLPNLGIIDGSVFVTAGAVNPTTTIVALARRAVDHLIETKRDRPTVARLATRVADRAGGTAVSLGGVVAGKQGLAVLSPAQRNRLRVLADWIVPAASSMPAASQVGVEDRGADWVLTVRPDLVEPLERALRIRADELASLRRADGTAYDALVVTVLAAYYRDEEVRAAIGYPGQVASVVDSRAFPQYISEGLLDHLVR